MKCDVCDVSHPSVGYSGCDHKSCIGIKICKYCDIDGSSYNGWCEQ